MSQCFFRPLIIVLTLAAAISTARAEDCGCNPLAEMFTAQIAAVEKLRFTAMTQQDYNQLDSLLANDLVYAHSTGAVENKTQFLENLKQGKLRYRNIVPLPPKVRFYGDLAIVNGSGLFEVTAGGQDLQARLVYTAVHVLRGEGVNRQWQLISWHSSPMPAQQQ